MLSIKFLVDPYKEKAYYWEVVILIRKYILVIINIISNQITDISENKVIITLILNLYLIIFFKLHLSNSPYQLKSFNLLETFQFVCIIFVCLSAIINSAF